MSGKVFMIADTHFGDQGAHIYFNHPYDTCFKMNNLMIDRWNSVVGEDDIVYHLGDVGIVDYLEDADIIRQLNGTKYLIKGNHDDEPDVVYRAMRFSAVFSIPIVYERNYLLSHNPVPGPHINIHGNMHSLPEYPTVTPKLYCVSVERINFTPISFDAIKIAVEMERVNYCTI